MQVQQSSQHGCVVLTLAGRLDLAAAPQVQRAILKHLVEQPPAIICDLSQVEAIDPLCVGVFSSIRHPALGWPGTTLMLCAPRPVVADTLLELGLARRLAMRPSLAQALRNTHTRPPGLRDCLALGPSPTAAAAGRAWVREVCGRWGVQELTEPVVHARTELELRVELRGPRLHVAVKDQDPNPPRLMAAKEGADRGRGASRDPSRAGGLPGLGLVWSKLVAPTPRVGLVARAGLRSLLQTGSAAKLCLVEAPAGFGKTTLLTQWRAEDGGGRVAWVSLEERDNDPIRFWAYVVQALGTVEPGVGIAALQALQRPGVDLDRLVLPSLLNDLNAIRAPLVLVLDDYHLVTEARCHRQLDSFLEHLPAEVHVVLATRVDPPLQLARMRARGELAELRVAELRFTYDEAFRLLNASMGLQLTTEDVERLAERTEG